jgi:hypothetical protein
MLDSSASASATDSDSFDTLVIPPDDALTLPDPETAPDRPRRPPDFKILVVSHKEHLAKATGDARCLENIIADQLRDFGPNAPRRWQDDRAVFAAGRIVAVIRRGANGSAILTRFA